MVSTPNIDRTELERQYEQKQAENDAYIREQVLVYGRRDVLAKEVLGYQVQPFHLAMMLFMAQHTQSLQLVFRGAGKTTVLTVTGVIFDLITDPNCRICIASKTEGFAVDILREIKGHLETNPTFRRIFGDLVGSIWNDTEILISTREKVQKESSVTCYGVGGQVTGSHFDHVYLDDLVDEDNARTAYMRDRVTTWFKVVLTPTIEPHAHLHIIGTRYHFDDLYGRLSDKEKKGQLCNDTQIIPALDKHGRSPWPSKFPAEFFQKKRDDLGIIAFSGQYLCNTEAMKGEIFHYDWMDFIEAGDVPEEIRGFGGGDLAIKQDEDADKYGLVGIAIGRDKHIYILNSYTRHLRFSQQTAKFIENWRDGFGGWFGHGNDSMSRLVEIGVENNAYQDAQLQTLQEEEPTIRVVPVKTLKDKITRAHKLAPYFERGMVHIVGKQHALVEQLVLFPNAENDDLFDALDIAVTVAFRPRRGENRKPRRKVGVI